MQNILNKIMYKKILKYLLKDQEKLFPIQKKLFNKHIMNKWIYFLNKNIFG